jgi:DNA polymerase-3 subunit epsilon
VGGIFTRYGFVETEEIHPADLQVVPQIPETFYFLRHYFHRFSADQIQVLETVTESSPLQLGFF